MNTFRREGNMKKILCFILLFCLFTVSLFAGTFMEVRETVDDFGDPTGEKALLISTNDFRFSSYYTAERPGVNALIIISNRALNTQTDYILGILTPYSSGMKRFGDDKISITYKAGENKPVSFTVDRVSGVTFFISGSRFKEVINALKQNNKIQFVVKGTSYEADAKYHFTFEYDKNELNEKLREIGR